MAAGGAGGRDCNPWGQGPGFARPVHFQGLGVAPGSHRDPVGSGRCSGSRLQGRGGAVILSGSRAPGARQSPPLPPLPPCSWSWWGGTLHLRTDAGCSASSASAAAARPERCPLAPGSLPETRGPGALTGLRRPSASRGVHEASGPASPAAAPPIKWTPAAGPGLSVPPRCRPEGGQTSSGRPGLREAEGRGAPAPGATALEPLEPAGTGLQGHRAGPGHRAQASRTQVL